MVMEFQGEYRFLSNFWGCEHPVEGEFGLRFNTVEHAYQAAKCEYQEDAEKFQSLSSPGEAKRLGRQVKIRPDWEEIKLQVMEELVRDKFSFNPELKEKLLATGDQELQEGNRWGDTFWGVDLRTGRGENHLGRILMKVRGELRRSRWNFDIPSEEELEAQFGPDCDVHEGPEDF